MDRWASLVAVAEPQRRAGRCERRALGEWLLASLYAERERWPLWAPVGLGAGIALYFALAVEPPPLSGPLALVATLALWLLARRGGAEAARLIALPPLIVALGFAAAQTRTLWVAAPVLERPLDRARLEATVIANLADARGRRLLLGDLSIAGLEAHRTPARVRIRAHGRAWADVVAGERVRLRAGLRPPPGPASPDGFDFARQAYFERLGAVGFARGGPERLGRAEESSVALAIGRLRQAVTDRLRAGLAGDEGALAAALLTGERGGVAPATLAAMRDAGLAHLLAISGLHMGLVALIVFAAVRAALAAVPALALRYPIKKWAAGAALVATLGYLVLSGATVPTQRAFLMTGLFLLAVLVDRLGLTMRAVAWAATALLLLAPESLLGASFQLSFAAVTALVAFWEAVAERESSWRARGLVARVVRYPLGVAATTAIASLATAPFAVAAFDRVAAYGLAANLVAVPLTALWIMPWGLLALALMPLGLEGLGLAPMGLGLAAVTAVAREVASWPGAVVHLVAMPEAGLALAVAGGLWLALWRRRWRWLGLPIFALGALSPLVASPADVWVAGDGRLFALRHGDALAVSSLRIGRYEAEQWRRRGGLAGIVPLPEGSDWLACDRLGCIARLAGKRLAIVRDGRALAEDCARADVVVALVPVRGRCPPLVLDRFDLWREGAHSLRITGDGAVVDSVARHRGRRPWVLAPGG